MEETILALSLTIWSWVNYFWCGKINPNCFGEWNELRNRETITISWVNIVVKLNALELVSSYPSLRICLDVLTVYVRTVSHVTAGTQRARTTGTAVTWICTHTA